MSAARKRKPQPTRAELVAKLPELPRLTPTALADARVARVRAFFAVWALVDGVDQAAHIAAFVSRAGGQLGFSRKVTKGARRGMRRAVAELPDALAHLYAVEAQVLALGGPELAEDWPADAEVDTALTLKVAKGLVEGLGLPKLARG